MKIAILFVKRDKKVYKLNVDGKCESKGVSSPLDHKML